MDTLAARLVVPGKSVAVVEKAELPDVVQEPNHTYTLMVSSS